MLGSIVSLTVVVICVAAIMMPVIADAQLNAGAEATLENTANTDPNYNYKIWDGSDITMKYTASTGTGGTYTIDGVEVEFLSYAQRIVIASNDFATRSGGAEGNVNLNSQYVDVTTQFSNVAFTFTVVDKKYTLEIGSTTYTGTVDWMVYAVADGDSGLIQLKTPTSPFYTSLSDDIVVLGNIYTTGDNDTFYSYYGGDLTVNETYADDSSVSLTKTPVDGYTDIYSTVLAVNVGDETFTPYFILAPEEVTGHEASGAAYSLYGAIPIIVIAGIVVASIGMVVARRD